MKVSSNYLFHLTNKIDIIKSILSDKFYGSFCKETLRFDGSEYLYVPMICFCDIPLNILSNQNKYGKFAIGMTKEWGIRNELNPVQYIEKKSSLSKSIVHSFLGAHELLNILEPEIEKINIQMDQMLENQKNNIFKISEWDVINENRIRTKKLYTILEHIRFSLCFNKTLLGRFRKE